MTFENIEEIYAALDKTRGKIADAVSVLTPEQANFQPAPEKWSVALIVEHLAKTEANLVRVVKKLLRAAEAQNQPTNGQIVPPVDFTEMSQKVRSARLEAPEFIRPSGGAKIAESLAQMAKTRAELSELRSRLEAVDLSGAKYPHPFFGELNLYQWLAFIGFHEAHHFRQIEQVIAAQQEQN